MEGRKERKKLEGKKRQKKKERGSRKQEITKYFPVGYPYQQEMKLLKIWLIGSIIGSFSFFYRYYLAYRKLYYYHTLLQKWVLQKGVLMEPFSVLSDGIFRGFWIGFLLLGILAFCHYRYYYQGSKSIYLMKRLPDRWLCLKSCIVVPIVVGILFLIIMVLLYGIYFGIYIWVTPKGYI